MSPLTLDATDVPADVVAEEEFELDMRAVEATTPLAIMMCATGDGFFTTCSTSACNASWRCLRDS
ncbi:FxLD family lanthipeptide [Nonomuraea sp. K274]|uniref:FxLD family lanthipeptide n=1 Tax=Nonomuraea cypriaca TaxID=1187855 RepID=A0A931EW40_9ACTN|nr:FxLD family lanthipeptide [Nonomuraea cypriaca]MBF8186304.1 FxLD family lanthipeptide [Nonomuraea cypriaca]